MKKSFENNYYSFFERMYNQVNLVNINQINFSQSWLQVFWSHKIPLFISLLLWSIANVWDGAALVLIGYVFSTGNNSALILILILYLIRYLLSGISLYLTVGVEKSIIYSIKNSASNFFLSVDPIHHSTKSSGQIQSKIDRCADGYQDIIINVLFKLLPAIISPITSLVILFNFDYRIGIISSSISLIMVVCTYAATKLNTKIVVPKVIKKEDDFKKSQIESLYQNTYIRSVFGTPQASLNSTNFSLSAAYGAAVSNFSSIFYMTISRAILWVNILFVGIMLFESIKSSNSELAVTVAAFSAFIMSQNAIVDLGLYIDRFVKAVFGVKDLFKFINNFGEQTFPVLDKD